MPSNHRPDEDVALMLIEGQPHVAYYRSGWYENEGLMYASRQGVDAWCSHYVDQEQEAGGYVAFSRDAQGKAVLVYRGDKSLGQMRIARQLSP